MSSPRSSTSQLPVFGIRNLTGPENPPGLISITSREYDSTIQSEPSAKLLYLDEDDGELITVGSALELSERLDEPIPKYVQSRAWETRNPLDGRLVHVFDINRTPGSLMVWSDHEAYSSKELRNSGYYSQASVSPFADPIESVATLPSESSHLATQTANSEPEVSTTDQDLTAPETQKDDQMNAQTTDILEGIEQHLSGLANVLQVAATTLQKAAEKTRTTDTSVVEDILKGVKDILTEVGSFGLEAYKAFDGETSQTPSWLNSSETKSSTSENVQEEISPEESVSEPEDLALDEAERLPSKPIVITDNRPSPRVKFAASVVDVVEEVADPVVSPVSNSMDESAESFSEKRKRDEMGECERIVSTTPMFPMSIPNPSILDDGNEDADFTARYPPLMSIRRAHTVSGLYGRENTRGSRRSERDSQPPQFKPASHHNTFPYRPQNNDKPESAEPASKPIPGAWPNFQNESTSALPAIGESSGAFFNRMTGRDRTRDMSSFGLHRANTTAASNPASRLNGPFDPVSAYQSPDLRSSEAPFRPRRNFVSSSRARYQPPWARSARDDSAHAAFNSTVDHLKEDSGPTLRSKHSMPAMRYSPVPVFGDKSVQVTRSDNLPPSSASPDAHRVVKHHRSVPQFHAPPFYAPRQITVQDPSQWPQPSLDLLTGPSSNQGFASSTTKSPEPRSSVSYATQTIPAPPREVNSSTNSNHLPPPPQSYGLFDRSAENPVFSTSASPFHPSMMDAESRAEEGRTSSDFHWAPQASSQSPFGSAQSSAPPARLQKSKFDRCVDQLKMLGFGTDDSMVRDRLHVYAVAANGDVTEAVDMIEEDRRVSGNYC